MSDFIPDYMKPVLLAFKPFLFDQVEQVLHPLLLPDWEWPKLQVVTSPCPLHEKPVDNCTCGVYSTFDLEEVEAFVHGYVDPNEQTIPVMGIIQVLGHTVVEGYTLRSWGAFLWGIIRPFSFDEFEWYAMLYNNKFVRTFRPVLYMSTQRAIQQVTASLVNYNLMEEEVYEDE